MSTPAERPSWGLAPPSAGGVIARPQDGQIEPDTVGFELMDGIQPLGSAQLRRLDTDVYRLAWTAEPTAAPRTVAVALRHVVQRAFADLAAHRVEVQTTDEGDDGAIAMRVGLRREGTLRSSRADGSGRRLDVTVYAAVTSDIAPDSPGGFTSMLDSILPKKRLIAHVVITDPDGRILLCETTFKRDWELPGGVVEPAEPPALAAYREVQEELGVDLSIGRLLVVDWLPPYLGWSDALELLYDGGVQDPSFVAGLHLGVTEIRSVAWCTVEEAVDRVSALNGRRLPLLLPTPPDGVLHLQDGTPT